MDDDDKRRRRLLLLGKGAVLAHHLAPPLAAESDESEQPLQSDASRSCAAALANSRRLHARRTRARWDEQRAWHAARRKPRPA
jgi:hypothetical protein